MVGVGVGESDVLEGVGLGDGLGDGDLVGVDREVGVADGDDGVVVGVAVGVVGVAVGVVLGIVRAVVGSAGVLRLPPPASLSRVGSSVGDVLVLGTPTLVLGCGPTSPVVGRLSPRLFSTTPAATAPPRTSAATAPMINGLRERAGAGP